MACRRVCSLSASTRRPTVCGSSGVARPLVVIDPDIWRPGSQPQLIMLTELVGLACVDHETAGLTRCQQDDHRSAGCEIWMALKRRYGAHEWAWGTTGAPPAALDSVLILSPAAKTLSWAYGRRVRMTIGLPAGASLTARCSTQLWLARLGKTRMD